MQFLPEFIVAIIISALHILLSFNLKLPNKYKNAFRLYSIVVNVIFIGFLVSFSTFLSISQNIGTYYNGLATLYFLLFVPLGIVLLLLFSNLIKRADIEPFFLKLIIIFGAIIVVTGLIVLGYALFILTFYGFAPQFALNLIMTNSLFSS